MMLRQARSVVLALAFFTALAATAPVAFAQTAADKATARTLFGEGQDALKRKDCVTAVDHFERADKLFVAPTIRVGLARAYVCVGKFVKAKETFNLVIRAPLAGDASQAFVNAVEDARREVTPLDAQIGFATITITGPDAPVVTIDGEVVPVAALGVRRPMDPGTHTVRVEATGYRATEATVTVTAQQDSPLVIAPVEDASVVVDGPGTSSGSGDTLRLVGFISMGVGAAGLILGGVMGGLAIGKHDDLATACPAGQCPVDQQDNLDSYRTLGTVSTIGFIAGGVLAATGLVLVLVAPSGSSQEQATLKVGPTGVSAAFTF